jgi:hypothetical protein
VAVILEDAARMAMELPGVIEGEHHGHRTGSGAARYYSPKPQLSASTDGRGRWRVEPVVPR